MPFEKTSRSPRFVNCRGKKRSRARRAARRGKPWYDVFAASTSTPRVRIWTTQNRKPLHEPAGNTPRAISDRTEGEPPTFGWACIFTASQETPRNMITAIVPRTASVVAALRPWGRRNALTPFAIASTPVSAVEPDANARSRRKRVTPPVPALIGCVVTAVGQLPVAQRVKPTPITRKIDITNA